MLSPSQMLPEFFAFLGIDLFLALSLLTCLLEDRFPKAMPYVYQVAAVVGFGHILISRDFLAVFGEYTRFWICFLYLMVGLANVLALNIYLVALKGLCTITKIWSGAVTFPSVLISMFFVYQYSLMNSALFPPVLQIGLLASAFVMGTSASVLLSSEIARKLFRRNKEVI